MEITVKAIEEAHNKVMQDEIYGQEGELITQCFKMFPKNDDIRVIALKIGLVDITSSTHVSQHKKKISVYELAKIILNIKNIDERIKNGDPTVVEEIAKSNGNINLFSFASKYCCYHNSNLYGRDDYSIYDTIIKDHLSDYFNDVNPNRINKWRKRIQYKEFNDYITKKLNELNINVNNRKRKLDHFIWYSNKDKK